MTLNSYRPDDLHKHFLDQTDSADYQEEILSIAAVEDKLVEVISSDNTCEIDDENRIHIKWAYLEQAEALIYRINVYDPLPEFVIFTSDLPRWLLDELGHCGKVAMKRVITNAVRRIYESIDPEYFHINGIYGKVRWRFASE